MRILVLGLGNDLLSDDALGLLAAERIRHELQAHPAASPDTPDIEVKTSSLSGIALLDLFIGFTHAVIIDAVHTRARPPGSLIALTPADLDTLVAPSPHYAGIPELLALARQLRLDFPGEIRILAVEAQDLGTIGGPITPAVENALPEIVSKTLDQIRRWTAAPAR